MFSYFYFDSPLLALLAQTSGHSEPPDFDPSAGLSRPHSRHTPHRTRELRFNAARRAQSTTANTVGDLTQGREIPYSGGLSFDTLKVPNFLTKSTLESDFATDEDSVSTNEIYEIRSTG
ncbi:unnamed protein product [Protopolystoma xenopodis]|uniref:Uncharacterized protein n=1 Tax=Protopolystoma xenopodis TaxID=117903 RepID=A0A3S5CBR0_9PLAT|nr:unnamed protein product [Protopolystoma xenopodis]